MAVSFCEIIRFHKIILNQTAGPLVLGRSPWRQELRSLWHASKSLNLQQETALYAASNAVRKTWSKIPPCPIQPLLRAYGLQTQAKQSKIRNLA